jgi:HAD superfamily hydrolase (TIGR01509 family)
MVKAVLCDIDGTLVNSNWLHAAAWRDALAAAGIEVDVEEVRRQIGKGGDELLPVFVPWWKRMILGDSIKTYRKCLFQAKYLPAVEPFPKARDLLKGLKKAGIRITLATSADGSELRQYKKIADIDDLVDKSTSASDVAHSKPHPDIFEASLKKLHMHPEEVLALGDTPYDAEAAAKAKVSTVGVTTGGWSERDLIDAGCIEVYKDVADLFANLDQSAFLRGLPAGTVHAMAAGK